MSTLSVEDEVYDTVIGGHHEGPDDCTDTTEPGYSKVSEVTTEEAIGSEKCIVHGNICKRRNCGRLLDYRKTYAGTCLVVSWKHFGGRWAAQPTCKRRVRPGNLT